MVGGKGKINGEIIKMLILLANFKLINRHWFKEFKGRGLLF